MGTSAASKTDAVRWFVIFFRSGEEDSDRGDFPKVQFWQPNEETARAEAARVLRELWQGGDRRDWKAAGHPDPFAVAKGRHPIAQWILTPDDVLGEGQKT